MVNGDVGGCVCVKGKLLSRAMGNVSPGNTSLLQFLRNAVNFYTQPSFVFEEGLSGAETLSLCC